MRRILVSVVAAGAMLAVTPGLAMAHKHHRRHHRSHHAVRVHHRRSVHHRRGVHHRRARHETFGKGSWSNDSTGTAGTVTSFDNGVLTITLNDGSTVSGN